MKNNILKEGGLKMNESHIYDLIKIWNDDKYNLQNEISFLKDKGFTLEAELKKRELDRLIKMTNALRSTLAVVDSVVRMSLQPDLRLKVEKLITEKALTMQELMKACECGKQKIRNALAILPVIKIKYDTEAGRRRGIKFKIKTDV